MAKRSSSELEIWQANGRIPWLLQISIPTIFCSNSNQRLLSSIIDAFPVVFYLLHTIIVWLYNIYFFYFFQYLRKCVWIDEDCQGLVGTSVSQLKAWIISATISTVKTDRTNFLLNHILQGYLYCLYVYIYRIYCLNSNSKYLLAEEKLLPNVWPIF